jgi:uncharacterized protein
MLIHEMTQSECAAFLTSASVGRLGCSLDDQPYVVPITFAFEPGYLYVISTFGQKIKWMRKNPKVCVEVTTTGPDSEWTSVIANGRYQELPEPQFTDERAHAHKLLSKGHHWGQNAFAERRLKSDSDLIAPLYFRIQIDSVTGLRAAADAKSNKADQK